jgi:uncharacterized protein YecT (DUF1311 family)
MNTPLRRRLPLLLPALLWPMLIASCDRSDERVTTPEVAQDTMLLHDLAQANRNTAYADMDTTIPVIVRSRTDGEELVGVGGGPANAREILTPSGSATRAPRGTGDAPTIPPGGVAPPVGDPCDSPNAEDQRTCLNRAIARSDVGLNRAYQELIAQAKISGGDELEGRFRDQQRDWIFTRDEDCRNQTRSQEGTLWARVRARCLADYSAKRASELQGNLNRLRGQ